VAVAFNDGLTVETGEAAPASEYQKICDAIPAIGDVFPDRSNVSPGVRAATVEFILEGLHLHKLLNKFDHDGSSTYAG